MSDMTFRERCALAAMRGLLSTCRYKREKHMAPPPDIVASYAKDCADAVVTAMSAPAPAETPPAPAETPRAPSGVCTHEAWEQHGSSRRCADCRVYLGPDPRDAPLPPIGPDRDGTRLEMTPNGDGTVRITAHNDPVPPDPRDAELAKLRAVAEAAARLQRWNYDGDSSYQEGVDSRAELSSALDDACPGWRAKEAGR